MLKEYVPHMYCQSDASLRQVIMLNKRVYKYEWGSLRNEQAWKPNLPSYNTVSMGKYAL